ncbi:Hypothetical predicted protein [Xyrichtys novacula]|uniref:Uncharacterized protein n=1 Tax=Xyrichtys novacula TaxID=13765 RepID=A0AAV1GN62_XYRNO|nr:Hypothetical predicted protein [Xyrichtys novacula]
MRESRTQYCIDESCIQLPGFHCTTTSSLDPHPCLPPSLGSLRKPSLHPLLPPPGYVGDQWGKRMLVEEEAAAAAAVVVVV